MKTIQAALLCLAVCAAWAAPAQAQMTWTDRAFVNVNVGSNSGSPELAGDTTFSLYDETGTMSYTGEVKPRTLFDISGGVKVWRNLALGLGFSRVSKTAAFPVSLTVPDPLFFDSPRNVTAEVGGLDHSQKAVHIIASWFVPVTDKIDVALSGGPTFFSVGQDLPEFSGASAIAEPGPTVTLGKTSLDESATGFNVGVDVTYLVTRNVGAGLLLRYTGASVEFEGVSDKIDVGGLQIGGGLRVRF